MRTMLLTAAAAALVSGCGDPAGPPGGTNPSGDAVAIVNTMSNTVDLYYPESDTIVSSAYVTGSSPNDALLTEGGMLAVVCSLDDRVELFDLSESGPPRAAAQLPAGSNPYTIAGLDGMLYTTMLLGSGIAEIDPADMTVRRYLDTAPYPSGVAASGGLLWVSHGYGTLDSIGMVSVVDPVSWTVADTVQTAQNAFEASGVGAGEVHVLTTSYQGDGEVFLLDAYTGEVRAQVDLGGTPSISARPREWACGWLLAMGSAGLLVYDETGVSETMEVGMPATDAVLHGGLVYVASFAADAVLVWDPAAGEAVDTLQAGSGPIRLLVAGEGVAAGR